MHEAIKRFNEQKNASINDFQAVDALCTVVKTTNKTTEIGYGRENEKRRRFFVGAVSQFTAACQIKVMCNLFQCATKVKNAYRRFLDQIHFSHASRAF